MEKVKTYTCPLGGKVLRALTMEALAAKIELHKILDHPRGDERCEERPMQPVAPIVRAYHNEGAQGVTS